MSVTVNFSTSSSRKLPGFRQYRTAVTTSRARRIVRAIARARRPPSLLLFLLCQKKTQASTYHTLNHARSHDLLLGQPMAESLLARLNDRFQAGQLSSQINDVGILVHQFEYVRHRHRPLWEPCPATDPCAKTADRFSAVIINSAILICCPLGRFV